MPTVVSSSLMLSAISSNKFLAYGRVWVSPPPHGISTTEPAFIEWFHLKKYWAKSLKQPQRWLYRATQNRETKKKHSETYGYCLWHSIPYTSSCYETTISSYWNMTYLRPLRIARAGNEGKCISMTTLAILSVPPRTFQCDPCAHQHKPYESHLCHHCKPYESHCCQCACDHSQFFLYTL